jgi:16S rRNA (uracil1498-N3)-methyltransferase
MSERFYLDQPLSVGRVEITGPEAHHMIRVCRFRPGDALCLFNGNGHEYPARVEHIERRTVTVEVLAVDTPERELGFAIEVAAPLPKGDRSQFLVEKLTELGVTSFVPLSTERSVIHPRETKVEKLQRHVSEASKQCGRNVLMRVKPPAEWHAYCRQADLEGGKILAHLRGLEESSRLGVRRIGLAEQTRIAGAYTLAIGPEGGLSAEEVAMAEAAGWSLMDLGPRILRVETAALVLAVLASSRGTFPMASGRD